MFTHVGPHWPPSARRPRWTDGLLDNGLWWIVVGSVLIQTFEAGGRHKLMCFLLSELLLLGCVLHLSGFIGIFGPFSVPSC